MIRVLLFLCSCAIAFAGNSTSMSMSFVPSATLSPSPAVNTTTHSHTIMTTSSLVSPVVNTSTVYTNSTVAPYTTSVMPMTSTPAPPPTTPTPTPTPQYDFGHYNVKRSPNGTFCLLAQMDAKIDVKYRTRSGSNNTAEIHLPYPRNHPDVKVNGFCGDKTSNVVIMWNGTIFELKFERFNVSNNSSNHTTEKWMVEELSLFINTTMNSKFINPDSNINVTFKNKNIGLKVPKGSNYLCHVDTKYSESGVTIHFSNVKLQPFDVENNKFSNKTQECEGDLTPSPSKKPKDNNIVPIAVGCALAGLVLIVLIAYIIGRRKSQRGYEKV